MEIENAVLGALILVPAHMKDQSTLTIIDEINSNWFQDATNKTVFQAIQALRRENNPIDMVGVVNKLKGIVEPYYISTLTNNVASTANIVFHIRLLQQEWVKSELIKVCGGIYSNPDKDPFQDITKLKQALTELELTQEHKISNIRELVETRGNELEARRFQDVKTVGHRSGFYKLDKMIGGLVPGELIICAARPGMGKTSFAVNLALEHCKQKGRALMFSIEMPENQIADRVISSETKLNNQKVRNADLDDYDMAKIHALNLPDGFYINDNSRLSIDKICNVIRQMKIKHNLTFVVVDYLQLIKADVKSNREQEVAYISSELKRIAKECSVCVMSLAQLSRKVEERGNKVPMLSDLRESGSIEQDADVVLFPFRPQYYLPEQDEIEPAEIHIGKCRNGQTGFIDSQFIGALTKYVFE